MITPIFFAVIIIVTCYANDTAVDCPEIQRIPMCSIWNSKGDRFADRPCQEAIDENVKLLAECRATVCAYPTDCPVGCVCTCTPACSVDWLQRFGVHLVNSKQATEQAAVDACAARKQHILDEQRRLAEEQKAAVEREERERQQAIREREEQERQHLLKERQRLADEKRDALVAHERALWIAEWKETIAWFFTSPSCLVLTWLVLFAIASINNKGLNFSDTQMMLLYIPAGLFALFVGYLLYLVVSHDPCAHRCISTRPCV